MLKSSLVRCKGNYGIIDGKSQKLRIVKVMIMKLWIKTVSLFDRLIDTFGYTSAVILACLWGLIALDVILRNSPLNYSLIWVVKISEYLIFAITFFSAAWLLKKGAHVRVDLVYVQLKGRVQAGLDTIMSTLGTLICLILTWYGMKAAIDHLQRGIYTYDVIEAPIGLLYLCIPVGLFLAGIQFGRKTYYSLILWRKPQHKEVAISQEKPEL
ncbi:TRAP transporter small permease [Chloroflexota bacterium]